MRRLVATALIAALFTTPTANAAARRSAGSSDAERALAVRSGVELISERAGHTVLRLRTGTSLEEAATLVRVPDTGAVEFEVLEIDLTGPDGRAVERDGIDVRDLISVSEPAIMRDLRVVSVNMSATVPSMPEGTSVRSATVAITTTDEAGVNEKSGRRRGHSPTFMRIYDDMVVNYDSDAEEQTHSASSREAGRELEGSRYVIIVDDSIADLADSLVAWKETKGLLPVVVTPPGLIWTRMDIRDYVENAYYNWDIPVEFVLLLGDVELVPTGGSDPWTDNYYAAIEGEDYLGDILVGRIPADNAAECRTMLAKTLAYDRPWLHDETVWPRSASLIVREDGDESDAVYYGNTMYARDLMVDAGFADIDTLFTRNWSNAGDVYESLAEGKGFLAYRGVSGAFWVEPFQVLPWLTESRWELPVVLSATCMSGDYFGDESVCEYFLEAGDEIEPRGAAAFFGTSTAGAGLDLSYKRGHVYEGFFAGVFGSGSTLGEACAAAKLNLDAYASERVEYEGWNLLGDPELAVWTAESSLLAVTHEDIIALTSTELEVQVTDGRDPVEGALVAVSGMPELFSWAMTDAGGSAFVPLALSHPCTLDVSVTAKNARPSVGSVVVLAAGPFVAVEEKAVEDDQGGNGDGYASPGETLRVSVRLINLGDQTAPAVEAVLRSSDQYLAMVDSLIAFGDVSPDSTVWNPSPFTVAVDAAWPGGYDLPLELSVSYGDSLDIYVLPSLETVSGDLVLDGVVRDDGAPGGDGDGALEPGEIAAIEVTLENASAGELTGIAGTLASRHPGVTVTSAATLFPDADQGAQGSNGGTPFVVSVAPDAPPGDARLFLRAVADAPEYVYAETLCLNLEIAEVPRLHPTGPDNHGYYAYDSTDTLHASAPRFEWTEIAPPGPGVRVDGASNSNDGVVTLDTPFVIRYYGLNRQETSICSNGFVALYETTYRWGDNNEIPDLDGPPSMLAPFWDDLDTAAGGDVYVWLDPYDHRYIIEFDEVQHRNSFDTETFQVVIYDPAYHETPTGDAEILFLYKDVTDPGDCTVGIEHPYQNDGVQYLFDGDYGGFAAPLEDGLAVLFTTVPPEELVFPWLVPGTVLLDDSANGDGDGVPETGEEVSLAVELHNQGSVGATGLSVLLSTDSSSIVVTDGTAAVADIEPGSSGLNADPLTFSVDEAGRDSLATLWLQFSGESNTRQGAIRLDIEIDVTAVPHDSRLLLHPGFPNPFRGETSFALNMPEDGRASVRVYDVAGRLVRTIEDSVLTAGPHQAHWDGTDTEGNRVASGVYFVRLTAGGSSRTRKTVLLR